MLQFRYFGSGEGRAAHTRKCRCQPVSAIPGPSRHVQPADCRHPHCAVLSYPRTCWVLLPVYQPGKVNISLVEFEFKLTILQGVPIVVFKRFEMAPLLRAIKRHRSTHLIPLENSLERCLNFMHSNTYQCCASHRFGVLAQLRGHTR